MFTLRNLRNIVMMSESVQSPIMFKGASPLAKLMTRIPPESTDIYGMVQAVNEDPQHEAVMSALVNEIKPLMTQRISYIRNTIAGVVEDIYDEVNENAKISSSLAIPYDIAPARIPNILAGEFLTTFTRDYREAAIEVAITPKNAFPMYSADELIAIMNFLGDDRELISDIADLVDSTSVSVVDIYSKWFLGITPKGYPTANQLIAPSYTQFMYTEWAIVFLLAQGFHKNLDPNVNMRLDQYNLFLLRLIANTGKYLYNGLPRLKAQFGDKGALWIGNVTTSAGVTVVIVNAVKYVEALNAGTLTAETVLGLAMLGKLHRMPHGYDEKDIDFAKATYNARKSKFEALELDRYKANVMVETMKSISRRINNGEFLSASEDGVEVTSRCKEILDDYSLLGTEQMFLMIRSVVTKGLYPNSGAYSYFNAMDTYQKQNPNIDPREAATLAARDVIVEYCVNQLVGVK